MNIKWAKEREDVCLTCEKPVMVAIHPVLGPTAFDGEETIFRIVWDNKKRAMIARRVKETTTYRVIHVC